MSNQRSRTPISGRQGTIRVLTPVPAHNPYRNWQRGVAMMMCLAAERGRRKRIAAKRAAASRADLNRHLATK